MKVITQLRQRFWVQIVMRGAFQSAIILVILALVSFLTRKELHTLRLGIPAAEPLSQWLSHSSSWDLFAYIFVVTTLFHYLGQLVGVFADRFNLRKLANWSLTDLDASAPAGMAGTEAARPARVISAVMGLRRRTLQAVLRSDPAFIATITLVACLVLLGHYWAGAVLALFSIFAMSYIPVMIRSFQKVAVRTNAALQASADRGISTTGNGGEKAIRLAESRLATIVNRPLVRIQVGWPVLVGAIACVSFVAFAEINFMVRHDLLPASSALLIAILALVARSSLSLARDTEDAAFFASNTQSLHGGEFDQEIL